MKNTNLDTIINKAWELKNSSKYSIVSALVTIFMMFFAGIRTVECYESFLHIAEVVFGQKVGKKLMEQCGENGLVISVGNDKIGEDTLICDVSCALDCYCRLKGYCDITSDCYALALEKFRVGKLLKNVLSASRWLSTSLSEKIDSFEELVKKGNGSVKYIRFNAYGDFFDLESLKTAFTIANYFYREYGIRTYFYTHNKELESYIIKHYAKDDYFVCNFSYPVDNEKQTIAVEIKDIRKYLNDDRYIICIGECHYCPYCKMAHLDKIIVFVKHGHGQNVEKMLRKALSQEEFEHLQNQKLWDYVEWRYNL